MSPVMREEASDDKVGNSHVDGDDNLSDGTIQGVDVSFYGESSFEDSKSAFYSGSIASCSNDSRTSSPRSTDLDNEKIGDQPRAIHEKIRKDCACAKVESALAGRTGHEHPADEAIGTGHKIDHIFLPRSVAAYGYKGSERETATSPPVLGERQQAKLVTRADPASVCCGDVVDQRTHALFPVPGAPRIPTATSSLSFEHRAPESTTGDLQCRAESQRQDADDSDFAVLETWLTALGIPPAFPSLSWEGRAASCDVRPYRRPVARTLRTRAFREDRAHRSKGNLNNLCSNDEQLGVPSGLREDDSSAAMVARVASGVLVSGSSLSRIKQALSPQRCDHDDMKEGLPCSAMKPGEKTNSPSADARRVGGIEYPSWMEKREETLARRIGKAIKDIRKQTHENVEVGHIERPWAAAQYDALHDGSPSRRVNRSGMTVPTSLIGRISALAAMERMKNPPDLDWTEINDGRHHLGMERSFTHTSAFVGPKEGGKGACPSRKHKHERLPSEVSAYLSIKAEQIRSRRDHNAWLMREAVGLDKPVQDPLTLLGKCLEDVRLQRDLHFSSSARVRQHSTATSASSSSSTPRPALHDDELDVTGLKRSQHVEAARRFLVSAPCAKHAMASSRQLLRQE